MSTKQLNINPAELEKLQKLLTDTTFVAALANASSIEEVQRVLADNGLHFALDEIIRIKELLSSADDTEGELDVGALEDVSGGVIINPINPLKLILKNVKIIW